jgi:DNA mismatch repair protein MutS
MKAVDYLDRNLPPMLQQYVECKRDHPECLILFQVGDFYEVFFEDAVTVARTLNLTLTSRDKSSATPIPMCGVPIAVVDSYLSRLVDAGFSVAVVSQTQPAGVGKGMVPRALERIVTPGIRVLGTESDNPAVVASLVFVDESVCNIAYTDLRHGKVFVRDAILLDQLRDELELAGATEVVVLHKTSQGKSLDGRSGVIRIVEQVVGKCLRWRTESYLEESFTQLTGMTLLSPELRRTTNLLLNYIGETTVDVSAGIASVEIGSRRGILSLDASARANLEIVVNSRDGSERGSLYETLNRTVSRSGSYTLRQWLTSPLATCEIVGERQDAVEFLVNNSELCELSRGSLELSCDCGRVASRLALGVVSPRELAALRNTLSKLRALYTEITGRDLFGTLLPRLAEMLNAPEELSEKLESFLAAEPPHSLTEGGIVHEGYSPELDRLRGLHSRSAEWFREFEAKEREKTAIASLKVKRNSVLGYFIEVTKAQLGKVPDTYIRRQSTSNADRFVVPELTDMQAEIFSAQSQVVELERKLFVEFRVSLLPFVSALRSIDEAMGELDVLVSFATLARERGYVRPTVSSVRGISIKKGRHPIVERALGEKFVSNSTVLGAQDSPECFILTGANMGGKSTYLRQVALLIVMAQVGSFIPAESATIGIVDKIFARIGASDNVLEGESTFMVEMREMSAIIQNATPRSLVIIDEVGRGTSTRDGYCLALAILEHLVTQTHSLTLFATHFHQLTSLEAQWKGVVNYRVGSVACESGILFTHEISPGAAEESYGLEVAKRAGFPGSLLLRAQTLLTQQPRAKRFSGQLQLFVTQPDSSTERVKELERDVQGYEKLLSKIKELDLNTITPLQAHLVLASFKDELRDFDECSEASANS